MPYDLLIKHGRIIDGSGRPAYTGDLAVQDGRIVEMGKLDGAAWRVIDADGRAVCPGFVDIHTHYDAQVLWDPLVSPSSWNGVTTCVMGNCGFTIAPCKPQDRDYLMRMLARVEGMSLAALQAGPEWSWVSTEEYIAAIDGPLAINIACLIGHSAVRYYVMGEAALERNATEDELRRMKGLVRQGMAAGAVGFSTSKARSHVDWGGNPVPSRFSTHQEVYELVQVLGEFNFGSVEMTPGSLPGIDEEEREAMVRMSRDSGRFLNWNELFQAPAAPDAWRGVLDYLRSASHQGARIFGICACQPTDQDWDLKDNNLLLLMSPEWSAVLTKPTEEKLRLLADPAYRDRIRPGIDKDWDQGAPPLKWDLGLVAEPKRPEHRPLAGMSLRELGSSQAKHPLDAMLDLAVAEGLDTGFAFKASRNLDDGALAEMMRSPYTILGISDAGAHVNMLAGAQFSTHVLGHWVREKGVLSLEQAVHKLTFMPASLMGFTDRGMLAPGMAADVLVFDPDTVRPLPKEKAFDLPNGDERILVRSQG
ncbi:MAG: amidohydrolase family protein, partial [Dehalococcoidia bacterium]